MNNPLGVSPSKGNQEATRGKEKGLELGTLPTELRGRTGQKIFSLSRVVP